MIDNWSHFIYMDGYGGYVWASYVLTLAVFIGLWWGAHRSKIRASQHIAAAIRREQQSERTGGDFS